jgi:hypothetical protein
MMHSYVVHIHDMAICQDKEAGEVTAAQSKARPVDLAWQPGTPKALNLEIRRRYSPAKGFG